MNFHATIVFIFAVFAFVDVFSKEFESVSFNSKLLDYTCTSALCKSEVLASSMLHIVVGTDHASSVPLLVFQVCEAIRRCLRPENMLFLLHLKSFDFKNENLVKIKYQLWNDTKFTANSKMFASYEMLAPYASDKQFVYQTDIDEMPVTADLYKAMAEVESGSCNAVRAKWTDRVELHGRLARPSIHSDLQSQFPLRYCCSRYPVPQAITGVCV